jgi:hypothetical protein
MHDSMGAFLRQAQDTRQPCRNPGGHGDFLPQYRFDDLTNEFTISTAFGLWLDHTHDLTHLFAGGGTRLGNRRFYNGFNFFTTQLLR